VFVLDAMLKEIRSAHHPWVISANRERLARASSASRIEEMTPMFFVREFAVEVRPEGHVLLANGGSDAAATIPWYQFRRRAQHLSLPARLLTHADPEFVARAANALNALLTEPPTPSFPPPPSPDPPS
jgi:hypothetical protein